MGPIVIKTNEQLYFRQLIGIFSYMPPFNKLNNRESEILSLLLQFNHEMADYSKEDREALILSTVNRKRIMEQLDIKSHTLRSNFMTLRKSGFIIEKRLAPWLENLKYGNNIIFKFEE